MKNPFRHLSLRPDYVAAAVALALLGLQAHAALAPVSPVPPSSAAPSAARPAAVPAEDIIDIRPPIHIPAAFPWLAWIVGALVAGGVGIGVWKWSRRPRRKLPYEMALEKLEATRPLMAGESAQPFSLAVSEIVRLFIEECLPVRAAHRTTSEFLHDLVSMPASPLAAHREALGDFLQHCDLAKFARWSLTVPQMEAMLASASAFVIAIGKPKPAKKQTAVSPARPVRSPEPAALHS